MDILATKLKTLTIAAPSVQKEQSFSLGGLSINFGDLLSQVSVKVDKDASKLIVSGAENSAARQAERPERTAPAEKRDHDRPDAYSKAKRYDGQDQNREPQARNGADHDEAKSHDDAGSSLAQTGDEPVSGDGADYDSPSKNKEESKTQATASGESEAKPGAKRQSANDGEAKQAFAAETLASGNEQIASGKQQATEILSILMAALTNHASAGESSLDGAVNGNPSSPDNHAEKGLAKAISAINASAPVMAGGAAINDDPQKSLANTHGQGQRQPNEQQQAQNQANPESAFANGLQAASSSQQAAMIAKLAGNNGRIAVNVSTGEESASVVSQPSSTLASAALTSPEGQAQQQKGHAQQNPAPNQQLASANPAMAQEASAPSQTQLAPAQASGANSASAKDFVQDIQAVNAGAKQTQGLDNPLNATANSSSGISGTAKGQAAHASNAHQANMIRQSVLEQVNVQITKAIRSGLDKINIQLKPENMGRVEVRLEISHEGRAQAMVIADSKETLELLQRDSRELLRSLNNAGLDLSDDGLDFSLREQNKQGRDKESSGHAPSKEAEDAGDDGNADDLNEYAKAPVYAGNAAQTGRIDIRA